MYRVVNGWNELPEEGKATPFVNAFKTAYDGWTAEKNPLTLDEIEKKKNAKKRRPIRYHV